MKFTLSWLKDYLDTTATLEQIVDGLVGVGLEVEEVSDKTKILAPFCSAAMLNAPGGIIGNLYFATWISFVITVVATAKDVGRVLDQKKNQAAATEGAVEGGSGAVDSPATPATKDEEKGKADAEEMGQEEMTHPEEMHE